MWHYNFERVYKPYTVHLYEVRDDNYLGTGNSTKLFLSKSSWSIPNAASIAR